jgi:hypothetical protein
MKRLPFQSGRIVADNRSLAGRDSALRKFISLVNALDQIKKYKLQSPQR